MSQESDFFKGIAMGNQVTYNYDLQAEDIARKQKIAEALQQASLQPVQAAQNLGPMASQTHWTNGLAKMVQAYLGAKGQSEATEKKAALGQQYQQDLAAGMQQYDKTSRGYSSPMSEDSGGNVIAAQDVKADPRKAIFDAMASNHPVLRDFAMKQMAEQAKGQVTAKDLLPYANPSQLMQNPADPTKWGSKSNLGEVDGMVYDKDNRKVVQLGGPAPTFKMVDGDRYQVSPSTGAEKKLDNAPRITNNVSTNVVNKGETKFLEGVGTANAKDFSEAKAAKVAAQRTMQSMQKLEQLDAQGVYSGPQAAPAMYVGSLLDGMGMKVDTKRLATSQAYQGELLANLGAQLTGSLARSTTDKDMEILKAPLPQLIASPEGRAALRRQAIAKAQEQIQYADGVQAKMIEAYPEAARLLDTSPGQVPVPTRSDLSQPTAGKTIKWSELP